MKETQKFNGINIEDILFTLGLINRTSGTTEYNNYATGICKLTAFCISGIFSCINTTVYLHLAPNTIYIQHVGKIRHSFPYFLFVSPYNNRIILFVRNFFMGKSVIQFISPVSTIYSSYIIQVYYTYIYLCGYTVYFLDIYSHASI